MSRKRFWAKSFARKSGSLNAGKLGRWFNRKAAATCVAVGMLAIPLSTAEAQNQMQTGDGLLQIQAQMPNEVRAGEQFQYSISVKNSSDNVVLHNIKLKQTESDGFTIESTSMQGQKQSGNQQSGNQQSGNQQSGNQQSGNQQSGNQQSGNQQSGNQQSGKSGEFTIDKLEPGESETIMVKAAADNEGELRSCLEIVSYTPALCMTSKVVKPDLQITKNAPEQADRCKAIELVYTVTNDGSGDVGTFQVVDELGDGLQTIEGNSTLNFPVDGLRAGDTRQFVARVFATRPGSFSSRAVAKAENSDLRARSARTTTEVSAADLQVRVEGPGRMYGEDVATFTAHVTNTGNTTANDVTVNVMWPQDASLVDISDYRLRNDAQTQSQSNSAQSGNQQPTEVTQTSGNSQRQNQRSQRNNRQGQQNQRKGSGQNAQQSQQQMNSDDFMISGLEPGQTATFQYAVRPRGLEKIETQVKALYVCAVDMAEGQDQAVSRITSTGHGQATIVRLPAMQMFIVDDEDPVSDGTTVTYTIRVTNEGDATEQDVQLTATLPEGLQFESANGPTDFDQQGSTVQFQPVEQMEPGTTVDYEVTATNSGEGSVNFKATLKSESLDQDVVAEEPTQLVSG